MSKRVNRRTSSQGGEKGERQVASWIARFSGRNQSCFESPIGKNQEHNRAHPRVRIWRYARRRNNVVRSYQIICADHAHGTKRREFGNGENGADLRTHASASKIPCSTPPHRDTARHYLS